MKTAKSSLRGNSNLNQVIADGVDYIHNWTKKELSSISKNTLVVLQNAEGSYTIGTFSVLKVTDTCWRVMDRNNEHVHDFSKKLAAVVYCVSSATRKYQTASDILELDTEFSKLDADYELFTYLVKRYAEQKDEFKVALYISRQEITKDRLNIVKDQLEKILTRAKVLK